MGGDSVVEHVGVVTGLADLANFLAAVNVRTEGRARQRHIVKAVLFGRPISLPVNLRREFSRVTRRAFPEIDVIKVPPKRVLKDRFDAQGYEEPLLVRTAHRRVVYGNALHKPFHCSFFAWLKADDFVFIDNGLSSYWDLGDDWPDAFLAAGVPYPSLACLSLSPPLAVPHYLNSVPYKSLGVDEFSGVYELFRNAGRKDARRWLPPNVIIGTSIFRTNILTWEEERGLFLRLIEWVRRSGTGDIAFKPHPRAADRPLIFESDGVSIFETGAPAEAFVRPGSVGAVYGVASTSLITFERYFGWSAYRIETEETRRAVAGKPHRGLAAVVRALEID